MGLTYLFLFFFFGVKVINIKAWRRETSQALALKVKSTSINLVRNHCRNANTLVFYFVQIYYTRIRWMRMASSAPFVGSLWMPHGSWSAHRWWHHIMNSAHSPYPKRSQAQAIEESLCGLDKAEKVHYLHADKTRFPVPVPLPLLTPIPLGHDKGNGNGNGNSDAIGNGNGHAN